MMQAYIKLCKPRVVLLMLLTAIVGMLVTPSNTHNITTASFGLLGIGLLSSAGAAINHIVDIEWDQTMVRTKKRPLVVGSLSLTQALMFAGALAISGLIILWAFTNKTAAIMTLATMFGYAVVYTIWLKHATPQNIVIGGLSGALPPLLGWTCLTGSMDAQPWLLVLIIFAWTPAHFWALAIDRVNDYKSANIPMLPVTHGIAYTKLQVFLYTLLTIGSTYLPIVIDMFGMIYLCLATLLNLHFLYRAWCCWQQDYSPKRFFWLSIYYLMLLFAVMLIDTWIFIRV